MAEEALEGARDLERLLNKLETRTAKKVARKAVRAGSKVEAMRAKQNALTMVGGDMGAAIAKAITVRTSKARSLKRAHGKGAVGTRTIINPKYNDEFVQRSKAGKRNYIPAAIEYGHDNAAAIPFMRDAAESSKSQTLRALMTTLKTELLAEVAKR